MNALDLERSGDIAMALDLSPLENAVMQLEEALEIYDSDLALSDPRLKRHLRAAVIQAFEFTYELSFRMLRRYLEMASPNPAEIDGLVFNEIIRESYRQALVRSDLPVHGASTAGTAVLPVTRTTRRRLRRCSRAFRTFFRTLAICSNRLQERNEALGDPWQLTSVLTTWR